jgi:hypothetical protein
MRTVFEGAIQVAASDYTQLSEDGASDVEIGGLDDRLTHLTRLHFTLDYPFDGVYEGTVSGPRGVTLRQIIDAVRAGYRTMYEGTTQQDIPDLQNKLVLGTYGEAVHVIDDLVIESIELDEDAATVEIGIGS